MLARHVAINQKKNFQFSIKTNSNMFLFWKVYEFGKCLKLFLINSDTTKNNFN